MMRGNFTPNERLLILRVSIFTDSFTGLIVKLHVLIQRISAGCSYVHVALSKIFQSQKATQPSLNSNPLKTNMPQRTDRTNASNIVQLTDE